MSKQVWVRPATQGDSQTLAQWITTTPLNLFDPDIAKYPEVVFLCAHDSRPLMYMPVQVAAVLESLACKPDLTPLEFAEAIKQLVKATALLCKTRGIHELYFLCKDENVVRLAARHGFEELPWHTMRLKLDKIEDSNAQSNNPSTIQ